MWCQMFMLFYIIEFTNLILKQNLLISVQIRRTWEEGGRREMKISLFDKKNISIEIILKFAIFIILFLTYFNSFIYLSPYLFFIYLFIYRQGTLRVKGPTIISPSSNKLQSGERLLRMVTPRLGMCHIQLLTNLPQYLLMHASL